MILGDEDRQTTNMPPPKLVIGSSTKVDVVEEEKDQDLDLIGMVKGETNPGTSAKTTLKDRLLANQKRN
jgi:hypothetical protein